MLTSPPAARGFLVAVVVAFVLPGVTSTSCDSETHSSDDGSLLATWSRQHRSLGRAEEPRASQSTGCKGRRPLGLASSGGGFRAMWNSVAVTRAMGAIGYWPAVTHLSSVSGSSWFSSQLAFSREYFLNATAAEGSWGLIDYIRHYGARIDAVISSGKIADDLGPTGEGPCSVVEPLWKDALKTIAEDLNLPVLNWLEFITAIFNPFIEDFGSATYATAERQGLLNVTLMQCVSIPPTAWSAKNGEPTNLELEMQGNPLNYSIPACYIAPSSPKEASDWLFFPKSPLTVKQTGAELMLPRDPRIATITAASSAAEGFAGSKTLASQNLQNISSFLALFLEQCLPANLQNLGVPADGSVQAKYPTYRLIDGGYTESTSAAFNLGKMQADCRAGKVDCSRGKRLMIVGHMKRKAFPVLFSEPGVKPGQPSLEAGSIGAAFPGNLAPMPTIFREQFSELQNISGGWKEYIPGPKNIGTNHNSSRYFMGNLTTVNNSWFNVIGNDTVEVVLIEPSQMDVDTLQTPKPNGNFIDDLVGKLVRDKFGDTNLPQEVEYGPTNVLQESSLRHIFKQPDFARFFSD